MAQREHVHIENLQSSVTEHAYLVALKVVAKCIRIRLYKINKKLP